MVFDRLAGNGLHRWIVVGVFLMALGWFGVTAPQGADPPKPKPLTEKQKARLKERDRLQAEAEKLARAGKLAEAIATMEKGLAIERAVYGDVHAEVAGSLQIIAAWQEDRQDFKAAGKRTGKFWPLPGSCSGTRTGASGLRAGR
jgi:hypothetical protein